MMKLGAKGGFPVAPFRLSPVRAMPMWLELLPCGSILIVMGFRLVSRSLDKTK